MENRRAEIIIFSIFSIGSFFGGIFFAFSTPPSVYDLIISFFYGLASVAGALQVCDTYIEARKADAEWKQFIDPVFVPAPQAFPIAKVLRKKRKKGKKNVRRKNC